MLTNWRTMLDKELAGNNEDWSDVESNTMSEEDMTKMFDAGYGSTKGMPFTMWTKRSVYFPVCYDGAEWVECVSRDPDGKPTGHVGGG